MDSLLENNYIYEMDLSIQLTIGSEFLVVKDLNILSKVDKFLNYLCKKKIEKYYEILRKCSSMLFITKLLFKQLNNNDFHNDLNHSIIYIYNNCEYIFGKKLNKDKMAFYYSYFIFKFHKFYRTNSYSKYWSCILYENGYIKSFSDNYYIGIDNINDTDIVLNIEIRYTYLIWRNHAKKINYCGTKIKFQNKGKDIYPDFVNLKLLDKLITNYKYQSIISKNFL